MNTQATSPGRASGSLAVSVIVPTFREAENLALLIPAIHESLNGAGLSHEILIVDDNSQDGSEAVIAGLAAEHDVRMIVRHNERGLSSAVMRGFDEAVGDVLVCMDADLSHPPEKVPELIRKIQSGADFAVGSRYVPGGSTDAEWSAFRRLNSRIATLLARPLTNVRDPMSGFFAMPRSRFRAAGPVNAIGYKIGLELLIKTGAKNPVEIPIHFQDRRHGTSKLSLKQQLLYAQQLVQLLMYRMIHRTRRS